MSDLKLFITGATGYIGGEVLHNILNDPRFNNIQITALARTEAKANNLKQKINNSNNGQNFTTVIGDLDSSDILKQHYELADIVITTADVDHVPSAQVLAQVAKGKKSNFYIIHTSGTGVIADVLSKNKGPATKPISDLKDNDIINNLPSENHHRPVDKIILDIQESNPTYVKTVIVSPPTIFGLSNGYDHKLSVQVPLLATASIKNDQAFTVYSGDYIWSHVHIEDLGNLYSILLNELLRTTDKKENQIRTGKLGYYFAEVGQHKWSEVASKLAKSLFERKIVSKDSVVELDPKGVAQITGNSASAVLWGTNSYSKAELAHHLNLGWSPKYKSDSFWKDIDDTVVYITKPETQNK